MNSNTTLLIKIILCLTTLLNFVSKAEESSILDSATVIGSNLVLDSIPDP